MGTQPQCPLPTPQQNQTCFSPNTPCCLNPQHLDSCFLPISLPSAVLLVIQTLPIPQVTTTLASALMGQLQPRSTVLSPSLQCQEHLLMPLESSVEQKCSEFPPCTEYSNSKCLSPVQCSTQYVLPPLSQSLSSPRFECLCTF